MVASGFLRLVTHPPVFIAPTPLPDAQSFLDAVLTALVWQWVMQERGPPSTTRASADCRA